MKDITAQLPDLITGHVQNSMMKWCALHAPPGTDDATLAKILQTATDNRSAFYDTVAPQVVAHYIQVFEEGLVALREYSKGMDRASRKRRSLMDHIIGPGPNLSSVAPKPPPAAGVAPQPQSITIDFQPKINLALPTTKAIEFERDSSGKITSAHITKS